MLARTSETIDGRTGRYRCTTATSVDVHLRQLAARMLKASTPEYMADLLWDRDTLLDTRCRLGGNGWPA
jgi:hypothetical protein